MGKVINIDEVKDKLKNNDYPFAITCQEDNLKHTFDVEAISKNWYLEYNLDNDDSIIYYGILINNDGTKFNALIDIFWGTIEF